jgi:predicted dehydrogenase
MGHKKLRVGIIGCGRFAGPGHAPYYFLNRRSELAAACDINIESARALAGRYGVKNVYADAGQMLDRAGLDAVSVCTPTFTHAELTEAAAARGIHVLCEKPFAASVAEGERMISACRERGVALHVGFHMRYDPGIARARELAAGGGCGACFHAEFHWRGLTTMGNVPLVNKSIEIAKSLGLSTEKFSPDWRLKDPRIPGGVLEVFCHLIDLSLWMFGEPDSVEGDARIISPGARKPEHVAALLKYDKGPMVYLTMSSRTLALWESHRAEFNCEKGNIKYETNSQRQSFFPARVTVETGRGLLGSRKTIPPAVASNPAMNAPHYHKINNFILDALGELPADEEKFIARGEAGLAVDRVIGKIIDKKQL